jgi:hypothetical protein
MAQTRHSNGIHWLPRWLVRQKKEAWEEKRRREGGREDRKPLIRGRVLGH